MRTKSWPWAMGSLAASAAISVAAVEQQFVIQEPFGLDWGPDRVRYRIEFPAGAVAPDEVVLTDAAGQPVAVQLTDIEFWSDGQSVRRAQATFLATLRPDQRGEWRLRAGREPVTQPATDLTVTERDGVIELATQQVGVRLAAGRRTFDPPVAAADVPSPIQGLRLSDGRWIGRGWWTAELRCRGYAVTIEERGSVVARVRLRYEFEDDKSYEAVVELAAGQPLAIIEEEFNLAEGRAYEMPELPGEPGRQYRLVRPSFDPPERGWFWDWWGGTGGRIPSPNAYHFAFYEGFAPTHCEWAGRMFHLYPNHQGPTTAPLPFDKDSRVVSINAFLNWGSDESLFFGAYDPKRADEVAIIGLRPSRWLNPDLELKPIATLKQWTQTSNLWIDRTTKPDLSLRAPVMLGRRVYALGVLRRPVSADGAAAVNPDLMRHHIRLGRQRLDEIKDWVLEYPESARYPRLVGKPGDLATAQARARKWLQGDPHPAVQYLTSDDPAAGRRGVDTALAELRAMCQRIATESYDHNGYAMNLPRLAWLADMALGAPECTPEEAARIRRYVAACAYNALSPDYVPPREAGYAWGSANMMEALRLRGATPMVCLVPAHPNGPAWREFLARFLKVNAREKINAAGATLEIGGYGVMAIEFATVPALMLANADPKLDFSDLLPVWQAAGRARLAYQLPPDVRGGFRPAAPIGDSPWASEAAFPFLIGALAERDPTLAGELMWGVQESGGKMGGHGTPLGLLVPVDLQPRAPTMSSQHVTGSGVVFRSGFPDPAETCAIFNAGSFAIGHGHMDRHGFILYARGAPLMLDFGSQYQPHLPQAWLHNGLITFDHREEVRPCPGRDQPGCYYTGKVWVEHKVEPFTCLEAGWQADAKTLDEGHGRVTAFVSKPAADYAAMERTLTQLDRVPYMLEPTHGELIGRGESEPVRLAQPLTWQRQVVFVKSPAVTGPHYLVIRDTLHGTGNLTPALNYWGLADRLEVAGQRATFTGQHGVDVEVYVAEPVSFQHRSHRVGHNNGGQLAVHYQQTFGKPFREEQILLQIPQAASGGSYFSAIIPRQAGEPAPRIETAHNGQAIRIAFAGGRTDTVVIPTGAVSVKIGKFTVTSPTIITDQAGRQTVTELK